jgi:hypothetical protein
VLPDSKLSVEIIPNPLRSHGELRLHLSEPGMTTIGIYDMLGRLVRALPTFNASEQGEYVLPVDIGELRNGLYTVRAEQRRKIASSRFTVVR